MSLWALLLSCVALARAQDAPPAEESGEDGEDGGSYGATATVAPEVVPGATRLEEDEAREMPGSFGDPFRSIDTLPGVVPVLSGAPYVYVRGAPPSGSVYVYDDIPLPALYHLALGPALVHPRMVGPIRLYTGVSPARYGRAIGGVIVGEGPPRERPTAVRGEAELRLLDVNGHVEGPVAGGTVAGAVRYGYPGLLLSLFSPATSLAYWDYQLRGRLPVGTDDEIEVVALGAYDSLLQTTEDARLTMHFHRGEVRFRRRAGALRLGTALQVGWERSSLGRDLVGYATRFGPRLWIERRGPRLRWRLGADFFAIAGRFTGTFDGIIGGPLEPFVLTLRRDVPARSASGIHGELVIRPHADVEIELGLRADAWTAAGIVDSAVDPRGRVSWSVRPDVHVHVAGGVMRQPVSFPLPFPGLNELLIEPGLQTGIQGEIGVAVDLPGRLRAEVQGFYHHYDGMLFLEGFLIDDMVCTPEFCDDLDIPTRVDGRSYGGELLLRRDSTERVSGFVSYTLGWSEIDDLFGVTYVPNTDTRHVANAFGQIELGRGWSAGLRLFVRSGKPIGEWQYETGELRRPGTRLPGFFRLDAHVAHAWLTSWGRLRLSLEWFNTTLSREAVGANCAPLDTPEECDVQYAPAVFFPNLGVRGEI